MSKKFEVPSFAKGAVRGAKQEMPLLLAIAAVIGVGVTAVLSFKAAPKVAEAKKERDEELEELESEVEETEEDIVEGEEVEEDTHETAKKYSEEEIKARTKEIKRKYYFRLAKILGPVVLTGVLTGCCVFGSYHIQARRILYLTTAYEAATGNLKEEIAKYKAKLKEAVGEEKAAEVVKEVEDETDEENVKKAVEKNGEIYTTGLGNELFLDKKTNMMFRSSKVEVLNAFAEVSYNVGVFGEVPICDLYDNLSLPEPELANLFCFKRKVTPSFSYKEGPNGEALCVIKYAEREGDMGIIKKKSDDYDDREIIR